MIKEFSAAPISLLSRLRDFVRLSPNQTFEANAQRPAARPFRTSGRIRLAVVFCALVAAAIFSAIAQSGKVHAGLTPSGGDRQAAKLNMG
ncbi:MAG: hypothetical protein M3R68_10445, partial [Acidobacteriota bacterium]|nr:hypothetical protein [Acidobacteriota bacterium]